MNLKVCGKCKRELSIENFSHNRTPSAPTRRKSLCKTCVSAYAKRLRDKRANNGICRYCDNPVMAGNTRCVFHLEKRKRYRATAFARINALLAGSPMMDECIPNTQSENIRTH